MKKQTSEPDFIGGQGALTKQEEIALSQYFSRKKNKGNKSVDLKLVKTKENRNTSA